MLFNPIIVALLLSVACNLEAAKPSKLRTLYAAMEHAIATEKPTEMSPDSDEPDSYQQVEHRGFVRAYNGADLYYKLDCLKAYRFRELRDNVIKRAMRHFAKNSESKDNVDTVQVVKDACKSLALKLKKNKLLAPREFSPSFHIDTVGDKELRKLVNLNSFCLLMEESDWGKE